MKRCNGWCNGLETIADPFVARSLHEAVPLFLTPLDLKINKVINNMLQVLQREKTCKLNIFQITIITYVNVKQIIFKWNVTIYHNTWIDIKTCD